MDSAATSQDTDPGNQANSFATLLRRHRISRHLTQEELAYAAGLSVRAVRNAELGRVRCPRRDSVQRLAEALELALDDHRRLAEAARAQRAAPVIRPGPLASNFIYLAPDTSVTVVVQRDSAAVGISLVQLEAVSMDNGEPAIVLTLNHAGREAADVASCQGPRTSLGSQPEVHDAA
jgi:transcriptional regulator with XRE-family HTH domain